MTVGSWWSTLLLPVVEQSLVTPPFFFFLKIWQMCPTKWLALQTFAKLHTQSVAVDENVNSVPSPKIAVELFVNLDCDNHQMS
jgi:hypothetical protein